MKKGNRYGTAVALATAGFFIGGGEVISAADIADVYELNPVVVTATRTPVEEFRVQANVSVLTARQIEQRHYKDLWTALRDIPGIQTWGYGQAGYLTANSLRINGSDKIVVLIDGVRANQGAEIFSAGAVSNMGNIERVEVLKGSASALYGADAQGGVINIITKKGGASPSRIYFDGGSFGQRRYGVVVNEKAGDLGITIGAGKYKEGDFESAKGEHIYSRQQSNNYNINLHYDLKERSYIDFNYDFFSYNYNYVTPGRQPSEEENIGSFHSSNARLIWNREIRPGTTNVFSLGHNKKDYRPKGGPNIYRSFLVQEQLSHRAGVHLLTVGLDYERTKAIALPSYNAQYIGKEMINTAYYLQDQIQMTPKIKFIAGLRYTDPNQFRAVWTPSFNLGYEWNDNTNMYVSWSKFFDTPTINQMYSAEYGNPNLNPEEGKNFEVGVNHRFNDTFTVSTHYFYRNTTNFLSYDPTEKKYYNNDDEVRTRGFDIRANAKLSDHWGIHVGYTYLNSPATGDTTTKQKNYGGFLPSSAWNIGLEYDNAKWNAELLGRGIINRPGYSFEGGKYFPHDSYWVFDLTVAYQIDENVRAYAGVYNIFDQYYAEASDTYWKEAFGGAYASLPDGQDYWPMPGRSFVVGMECRF